MKLHTKTLLTALAATGTLIAAGSAQAATVSGSFASGSVSNANLTSVGSLDWRIWDDYDDTDDTSFDNGQWNTDQGTGDQATPEFNEKLGGTAISTLTTNLGSGALAGKFGPGHTYDYTDGTATSPAGTASATGQSAGVNIQGTFADLDGASLSFDVTTASTQEHTLLIYGRSKRTDTGITLSLAGASDVTSNVDASNWVYTATFTPDNAGDVLTVTLGRGNNTAQDNSFNNVRLGAAAVSVVPEPASGAMALVGLGALAMRRRRG